MARLEKENGHNATLQVLPNQGMYKTDCNTNTVTASPWDSLFPGVIYCDGRAESMLICRTKKLHWECRGESTTMFVHRKLHWVDIQDKEIALGMLRESMPMFVHRKLRCTQQKPLPGT